MKSINTLKWFVIATVIKIFNGETNAFPPVTFGTSYDCPDCDSILIMLELIKMDYTLVLTDFDFVPEEYRIMNPYLSVPFLVVKNFSVYGLEPCYRFLETTFNRYRFGEEDFGKVMKINEILIKRVVPDFLSVLNCSCTLAHNCLSSSFKSLFEDVSVTHGWLVDSHHSKADYFLLPWVHRLEILRKYKDYKPYTARPWYNKLMKWYAYVMGQNNIKSKLISKESLIDYFDDKVTPCHYKGHHVTLEKCMSHNVYNKYKKT